MLPAATQRCGESRRDLASLTMCVKPLILTAPTAPARERSPRRARAVVLPQPRPTRRFSEGYGGSPSRAARASADDTQPRHDEMLDAYAVIGTYDEIAAKLHARYGHIATSLEFAIPPSLAGDDTMLRELIDGLRGGAA